MVVALEFVYSAKLWGTPSRLVKFIVILALAGTVIVLLSKAMLSAARSMVMLGPVGVGDVVTVGVGDVVGVAVAV